MPTSPRQATWVDPYVDGPLLARSFAVAWIRSLRPYVRPQLRTFLGLHGEQLARQGGEALIRLDVDGHQGHDSAGLPGFIGMEEALCGSSTGELGVKRGSGALVIQHTSHAPIAAFRLEMRVSYSGSDNRASVTSEPEQITTTPEQAKSADTPTPLLPRSAQPKRGQAGYVINDASVKSFLANGPSVWTMIPGERARLFTSVD
jgi:hypothetical protein